jgi:hypothetical protein
MNASDGLFGIVTPYRNQANALQSVFAGSGERNMQTPIARTMLKI